MRPSVEKNKKKYTRKTKHKKDGKTEVGNIWFRWYYSWYRL
jgi:hypothetical protein